MPAVAEQVRVPELRFRLFDSDWELISLGDLIEFKNGRPLEPEISATGCVRLITLDSIDISGILKERHKMISAPNDSLQAGDLVCVLSTVAADLRKSNLLGMADFIPDDGNEYALNQRMGRIRPASESANLGFVRLILNNSRTYFGRCGQGTSQKHIYQRDFDSLVCWFPTFREQEKIAGFLTAVDERIGKLKRKKELLEEYKRGMMQKLFSQEVRFKDEHGRHYPDWEVRKLGEFLVEHGQKSEGNEEVFSVSVHKGLINQVEHLGRSFAAADTSHYNRINPNDVVYTKSPTGDFPYGIIKRNQSDSAAIVSPLYGVFRPESKGLGVWLDEYFSSTANVHNYLHSIIQKGAKNTISITNKTFLSKGLKMPVAHEEQRKIGEWFTVLNERIAVLIERIEKAEEFKRGLLQKMFV